MDLCPICSSSCKRLRESRRCVSCGTVRTDYNYDSTIYKNSYAECYIGYQQTPINDPLNLFRLGLISRWLRTGDSVLDIGCCIGEFIRFAERYYSCVGYDPNQFAIKIARSRVNSPIYGELNGKVPHVKMVTMFDVIEHLQDPYGFLDNLRDNYLLPNGTIVVITPNVDSIPVWDETSLQNWKHYKPEEHLFLYSEKGLTTLFERSGFQVIHVGQEESDIRPGNSNGGLLTVVARRANAE
jgi:SAM-dependent methyltransferase